MTRIPVMIAAVMLVVLSVAPPAQGVEPDEVLDDPALEVRARDLSREIRCVVCQNESIDSSNADIARDLRLIVRERLVAGDSNQAVLDHLVARYGDYVLLRPPIKPTTYVLWFGPALLLALGILGVVIFFRRRAPPRAPALSPGEEARIKTLMSNPDDPSAPESRP